MIQNREAFLANVASRLSRTKVLTERPERNWNYRPQDKTLTDKTQDELVDILRDQCRLIHTELIETDSAALPNVLAEAVAAYGGGPLAIWQDPRYEAFGLREKLQSWPKQGIDVHEWNPSIGYDNISIVEKSNIGITFSDITLAESGTVVLFSGEGKGRTVSLLPNKYIALIPKSTIVPRMTQAAQQISKQVQEGKSIASCINFITGPSNSADIEMNLVVGVHGPVKAAYIVIDDK
ncbi:L-lactate dehydrogenase complex protein LldG [Terribacillus halophilus]|uniref:Lactate utilization protein C n=1 Tax=Terribacillus halophilus TaxID=361279 RepID=A0A1G6KRL5_9BACI|nr:lactate utilization protein C [Terribacillus halophilus]SDC33614.1 L-lactate dehydrogenase complex protein LldG [Terribacillus halophilus]